MAMFRRKKPVRRSPGIKWSRRRGAESRLGYFSVFSLSLGHRGTIKWWDQRSGPQPPFCRLMQCTAQHSCVRACVRVRSRSGDKRGEQQFWSDWPVSEYDDIIASQWGPPLTDPPPPVVTAMLRISLKLFPQRSQKTSRGARRKRLHESGVAVKKHRSTARPGGTTEMSMMSVQTMISTFASRRFQYSP